MSVLLVNSLELLKNYIDKPGAKVLLMASATYCMPCKRFFPTLESVAKELSDKFLAIKSNLDESPDINDDLGVGSVPTLIFYKDGQEIYRTIGTCSRERLVTQVLKYFS